MNRVIANVAAWHPASARRRAADREKLMRELLMPSAAYLPGAYGLQRNSLGTLLLPAPCAHRHMMAAWKVLTGKK
jgi:hypothetical protein